MKIIPRKPPRAPKHTEERLKLAASGLQALAIALFGAAIVAPLLVTHAALGWTNAITAFTASIAEGAAFELLRYSPTSPEPRGDRP